MRPASPAFKTPSKPVHPHECRQISLPLSIIHRPTENFFSAVYLTWYLLGSLYLVFFDDMAISFLKYSIFFWWYPYLIFKTFYTRLFYRYLFCLSILIKTFILSNSILSTSCWSWNLFLLLFSGLSLRYPGVYRKAFCLVPDRSPLWSDFLWNKPSTEPADSLFI